MGKFKVGDKVRYIDKANHEAQPQYYPEVGTIGEIKNIKPLGDGLDREVFFIQWPNGTTSRDDRWYSSEYSIELVTEGDDQDA